MKTGIMGGTFNPPHLGHLRLAENAQSALGLDKVLFIPTNIPPHKELPARVPSPQDRCEMVRRLIEGKPWAQLSTMEIDRGGASYTVDTLRHLARMGEGELYLIIGTDMLLGFDQVWYAADEIAQRCTLAVCAREQDDWDEIEEKAELLRRTLQAKVVLIRGSVLPISSTQLREDPTLLRQYTTPAEAEYIENEHLYEKEKER